MRKLRLIRIKRPKGSVIVNGNDLKSHNIPSSMGTTVDEPEDRWMRLETQPNPTGKVNTIECYRIDDLYEEIDY